MLLDLMCYSKNHYNYFLLSTHRNEIHYSEKPVTDVKDGGLQPAGLANQHFSSWACPIAQFMPYRHDLQ